MSTRDFILSAAAGLAALPLAWALLAILLAL